MEPPWHQRRQHSREHLRSSRQSPKSQLCRPDHGRTSNHTGETVRRRDLAPCLPSDDARPPVLPLWVRCGDHRLLYGTSLDDHLPVFACSVELGHLEWLLLYRAPRRGDHGNGRVKYDDRHTDLSHAYPVLHEAEYSDTAKAVCLWSLHEWDHVSFQKHCKRRHHDADSEENYSACVISIVRWVSLLGLSKNLDVTCKRCDSFRISTGHSKTNNLLLQMPPSHTSPGPPSKSASSS